jgi:aryl-alcohol dehydrogenase-like predicted oxidoreductase
MKFREFGKTGFKTSEIGLGCWQLGSDWGEVSERTAESILDSALANGINFFDTADVYGAGRSESLIGKFLKKQREKIYVATKVGRNNQLYPNNYTQEGVKRCIEGSLKRLGVEALDLVQLHCIPSKEMKEGEIFEWLRDLKKNGLIKEFGASVESMEEALICMEQEDLCSLQIIFNVFRQKPVEEVLQIAQAKKVGIIVRLPFASGLLTGKFTSHTTFDIKDHRNYNRDGQYFNVGETFAGIPFEKGIELIDILRGLTPVGISLTELALRWILDFDSISVVIPGATRPEQVKQNADCPNVIPLSLDLHNQLKKFYEQEVKDLIRGPY